MIRQASRAREGGSSLRAHWAENRYARRGAPPDGAADHDLVQTVLRLLEEARTRDRPQLIVVRAESDSSSRRPARGREATAECLARDGFLSLLTDMITDQGSAVSLPFLGACRQIASGGGSFFRDQAVSRILDRWTPLHLRRRLILIHQRLKQLGFLIVNHKVAFGAGTLGSLATGFLTTLLKSPGTAVDQAKQAGNVVVDVQQVLTSLLPNTLSIVLFVLFVVIATLVCILSVIMFRIGEDSKLKPQWEALDPERRYENERRAAEEQLTEQPDELLDLIPPETCAVLVVDDIDFADSPSVEQLLALFQAALRRPMQSRLCVVLGFDPANPRLADRERRRISEMLEPDVITRLGGVTLHVSPLHEEEIRHIIENYLGEADGRRLLREIRSDPSWRTASSERVLGFLEWAETELDSGADLADLSGPLLMELLHSYASTHEREADQLIRAISAQDSSGQSLEVLRILLAWQSPRAPVTLVNDLLRHQAGYANSDTRTHERVLLEPPLQLLIKTRAGSVYEFREPRVKELLRTSWTGWPEQETRYSDEIFDFFCGRQMWQEADQALAASPSEEAIEVLFAEGLYHYQYYGHSDAGFALRFFAADDGGATQKWIARWQQVVENKQDPWELLCWSARTRANPFRWYYRGKEPPTEFFAPDLLKVTASAYWLIGQGDRALDLLRKTWPDVRASLRSTEKRKRESSPEAFSNCRERLAMAEADIALLIASIELHDAPGDGWDDAVTRCAAYVEARDSVTPAQQLRARFLSSNIEHYRQFATGMEYGEVPCWPGPAMSDLLSIGQNADAEDLIRLRALHSVCSTFWLDSFAGPLGRFAASVEWRAEMVQKAVACASELLQTIRQRRLVPEDLPPGGRADEAELFQWEAMFLVAGALLGDQDDVRQVVPDAERLLGHAETIYRQLDHGPGLNELDMLRALLHRAADPGHDAWLPFVERRLENGATLGFHLDHLWSGLLLRSTLPTANVVAHAETFVRIQDWFTERNFGLPDAVAGVALLNGARALRSIGADPDTCIALLKSARLYLEQVVAHASAVNEDILKKWLLGTNWYLATSLLARLGDPTTSADVQARLLHEAEECLSGALAEPETLDYYEALFLIARIQLRRREHVHAIGTARTCIEYFEREKDEFWLLQSLTFLEQVRESAEATGQPVDLEMQVPGCRARLTELADLYRLRFRADVSTLSHTEVRALLSAAAYRASECEASGQRSDALEWLRVVFDGHVDRGECGQALLTFNHLARLYEAEQIAEIPDEDRKRVDQAEHELRVTEQVDWPAVGELLLRLKGRWPSDEPENQQKLAAWNRYHVFRTNDLSAARAALEEARQLVRPRSPSYRDLEILLAYRAELGADVPPRLEEDIRQVRDRLQTHNFLLLAREYIDRKADATWALELATDVKFQDSAEYREAAALRDEQAARRWHVGGASTEGVQPGRPARQRSRPDR